MKLTSRLLPTLVLAALLLPLLAAPADKPNPQQEGAALLARAAELCNIRAKGGAPFCLRAKVLFHGVTAGPMEGSYVLLWSSPTQWRQETSFAGYTEIAVGQQDKVWRMRNLDYKPLRAWDLDSLFSLAQRLQLRGKDRARKVRDRKRGGLRLRCVELEQEKGGERELCLDSDRDIVVYEKQREVEREFGNYIELQGHAFPGLLRHVEQRTPVVEATILELAELDHPDESLFVPPSGAVAWDWCEDMKNPETLETPAPVYPHSARVERRGGEVVGYIMIDTDGTVRNIRVLASSSPDLAAAAVESWKGFRYRPATCNGKPVRTETIMRTEFHTW